MVERLSDSEDPVQAHHLDSYADFIQLCASRRLWVSTKNQLQKAFDDRVGIIFNAKNQEEGLNAPELDLYKLAEIFCSTSNNSNMFAITRKIRACLKDPTHARSTRKLNKLVNKICQNKTHMVQMSGFVEDIAREITPE